MTLCWFTVVFVAFLWTFGIGLQTKAIARSCYLPAALMGGFSVRRTNIRRPRRGL